MSEKYIIVHESVLESWIKDCGSLGSLAGLIYVNHQYGAGSAWVDAVGAVLLFGWVLVRGDAMRGRYLRFTREELRQWALREPSA